jgi:3D (Asp-Asp-Asp) domain-containing protein
MKKLAAIAFLVMSLTVFSPAITRVQASALDSLSQALVKNSDKIDLQTLAQLQQLLEQNKDQDVKDVLKKLAIEKTNQAVNQAAFIPGADTAVLQQAVKEQMVQRLDDQLKPYQQQVALISQLLSRSGVLQPVAVQQNDSLAGAPENYKKVINMTSTAYAPGMLDNGHWGNKTYMGGTVRKGVAAVDPAVIPMGSRLWIEGYGEAVAEDQGSAIKGNRIDLAFDDRQTALDYGIQSTKVYVLN